MARGQAEALMPMVEAVLQAADRRYQQISLIAATVGPGSFTGVRIGLSAARGMAVAIPAPTVAVTTLEALADAVQDLRSAQDDRPLLVLIDSKRGDAYAQWFDRDGVPLTTPKVTAFDALAKQALAPSFLVAGDATEAFTSPAQAARLSAEAVAAVRVPDAAVVARLAAARFEADGPTELRPLYLRAPEVGPASVR